MFEHTTTQRHTYTIQTHPSTTERILRAHWTRYAACATSTSICAQTNTVLLHAILHAHAPRAHAISICVLEQLKRSRNCAHVAKDVGQTVKV